MAFPRLRSTYARQPADLSQRLHLLTLPHIESLIGDGVMTTERIHQLHPLQVKILEAKRIVKLIRCGRISLEEALDFTDNDYKVINVYFIYQLIMNGKLSVEKAKNYEYRMLSGLEEVKPLYLALATNRITIERIQDIYRKYNFIDTFYNPDIYQLMMNDQITIDEIFKCSDSQHSVLRNKIFTKLICEGHYTLNQVFEFKRRGVPAFMDSFNDFVIQYILDGILPADRVPGLSYNDCFRFKDLLKRAKLCTLFERRLLGIDTLLRLNGPQAEILECDYIFHLITDNFIIADQAVLMNRRALIALSDNATRQRIRRGEINILDIIFDLPTRNHVGVVVNGAQSTHTASVHKTISESAIRLNVTYNNIVVSDVIHTINAYVTSLSSDSIKHVAAKDCINRITDSNYIFKDRVSKITISQILALVFTAINDDQKRIGLLEDALAQFIDALYEVQRGYNSSDKGVAKPICAAGAFNKILAALQGVHPDCQIIFMTNELASLKLPVLVKEESMLYLRTFANPQTAEDYLKFIQLMQRLSTDLLEEIWPRIKERVAHRMIDEFSALYNNDDKDPEFISLLESGLYTALPASSPLLTEAQESEGYKQYCRESKPSCLFTTAHYVLFTPLQIIPSDSVENQADNAPVYPRPSV